VYYRFSVSLQTKSLALVYLINYTSSAALLALPLLADVFCLLVQDSHWSSLVTRYVARILYTALLLRLALPSFVLPAPLIPPSLFSSPRRLMSTTLPLLGYFSFSFSFSLFLSLSLSLSLFLTLISLHYHCRGAREPNSPRKPALALECRRGNNPTVLRQFVARASPSWPRHSIRGNVAVQPAHDYRIAGVSSVARSRRPTDDWA